MSDFWKNLQGSYLLPVVVVVALLAVLFVTAKSSVWDFVAERVIDRMEVRYSPYGPVPPQITP